MPVNSLRICIDLMTYFTCASGRLSRVTTRPARGEPTASDDKDKTLGPPLRH